MLYKPKAYKHPVLAFFSPDYLDGNRLDCVVDLSVESESEPVVGLNFSLENSYLEDLFMSSSAKFAIDVHCPATISRAFYWVDSFETEVPLSGMDLYGEVEIAPLLVAREDIEEFRPQFINPEYRAQVFRVAAGEPLAISQVFQAEVQPDHSQPRSPFVMRRVSGKPDHYYELETHGNSLTLFVSDRLFDAITRTRLDKRTKHLLHPSIWQDVLELAIADLQRQEDDSRLWVRILRDSLLEKDISPSGDPREIAAHLLFSDGWAKALENETAAS